MVSPSGEYSKLGIFPGGLADDALEVNGKVWNDARGSQRLAFKNRRKNYAGGVSARGLAAFAVCVKLNYAAGARSSSARAGEP
jgi:hypothetical protein